MKPGIETARREHPPLSCTALKRAREHVAQLVDE